MTLRRWLITILSFAAAIGVSIYVIATSWPEDGSARSLPITAHALALVAVLLEIVSRVVKLRLSARALDIPLSFGTSTRTILGGDFAASITPARSGSEPARFFILSESGMTMTNGVILLFAELFLEMLSIAIVAAALPLVFEGAGAAVSGLVGVVGGYAAFVLGAGALGVVLARRHANGPPPQWARVLRLRAGRWRAVQRSLRRLRMSVSAVKRARLGISALALAASVLHVLFRLAVLPVLVLVVAPDVPVAELVAWPLALFYGGVVAPAPGGGGFIEVAFKATLGNVIPAALFPSALLWWRFYTFYCYIPLGALAAGGIVLRALRDEDEEEDEELEEGDEAPIPEVFADELRATG